jgi:iron complex outermembrane receptor protein
VSYIALSVDFASRAIAQSTLPAVTIDAPAVQKKRTAARSTPSRTRSAAGANRRRQAQQSPVPARAAPNAAAENSRERGDGPVRGYTASQSITATKTDTPILETPQSISVVTKDQIAAQQAHTVVEALRYTPGVTLDSFSANTFFDSVTIRGFQAAQYLDGLRLPIDPSTQFGVPRIEPYGLERLEVLKGPSSGLYGQTNPGGLLNMISKRPIDKRFGEIEGTFGNFDRFQGAFDIGSRLDKDGKFLFRLNGLARDSDSQIDFVQDNKLYISPSLTWRPDANTNLTILSNYQKIDNKGFQQYVPAVGSLYGNPLGRIPYSRYLGEPGVDGFKMEQAAIGYAFDHRFNDVFQFRQNLRYQTVKNDLTGVRTEGLLPDLHTTARSINYVLSESRNLALDNQLQADFATGPFKHKVLFGVDYINTKSTADYRFATIGNIDVFNPVYGSYVPPSNSLAPFILTDVTQTQTGVYLQDQVKFDRWTLSLTGRHDQARTTNNSGGAFPPPGTVVSDDSANTGRVGLNYLFDFGLSPYFSYATSFLPTAGTAITGAAFKPTTGQGQEIGVKFQAPGTNLMLTAALFDITQQNALTADPGNAFFSVQTGEVRVKGFEFEARGNLTRELEIVGGYSHLDPRVTRSNDGFVGNYVVNVAVEQASLWGMYTMYNGPLAGFGFGVGARYVGTSYGDGANTIRIAPYTLYDAALSYDFSYWRPQLKGLKAQLNATNLFDKYYVASCVTSTTYCGLGASRAVMLKLKYAW